MNLKILALTAGLLVNPGAIDVIKSNTKGDLIENTTSLGITEKSPTYNQIPITTNTLHTIKDVEIQNSTEKIIIRSRKDLKETPLFMTGIRKHIGEFLGYNQYQNILEKYNTEDRDKKTIDEFSTIKFPLIYDDFRTKVAQNLQERLKDEKIAKYSESLKNKTELLIIDKDAQNKYFLSYYANNKLILCTYISTGVYSKGKKSIETPKGIFSIGSKTKYRRSQAHDNAPMAYALHIIRGVYVHQGTSDGSKKSHGCIRVPGLYQEFLFYHLESGMTIVVL